MPKCCDLKTCERALEDYLARRVIPEPKPSPGPAAVCWETQDGAEPIRLSFSIKVF